MPRRAKGLTAAGVAAAGPGVHYDGAGVRLEVGQGGAASWIFRYKGASGKPRDMGLGSRSAVTLKQARARARELREAVRVGRDPLDERVAKAVEEAKRVTFDDVAGLYLDAHERGWRNPKHRQQWRNTLATYVSPVIGSLPVADVDTGLIVRIVEPLWRAKPE